MQSVYNNYTVYSWYPISSLRMSLGLQEFDTPSIYRHSTRRGGNIFSLTHWPTLTPKDTPVLTSVRGWVDPMAVIRPAGLCRWKIPVTPSGIKPAVLRLVAQSLNQLRHLLSHIFLNIWLLQGRCDINLPTCLTESLYNSSSEPNP